MNERFGLASVGDDVDGNDGEDGAGDERGSGDEEGVDLRAGGGASSRSGEPLPPLAPQDHRIRLRRRFHKRHNPSL